jgi:hypothetical protein
MTDPDAMDDQTITTVSETGVLDWYEIEWTVRSHSAGFVVNTPEDEPLLTGFMKWEGCMNVDYSEANMHHYCDPEQHKKQFLLMKHLYCKGRELMPQHHEYIDPWPEGA